LNNHEPGWQILNSAKHEKGVSHYAKSVQRTLQKTLTSSNAWNIVRSFLIVFLKGALTIAHLLSTAIVSHSFVTIAHHFLLERARRVRVEAYIAPWSEYPFELQPPHRTVLSLAENVD
jgi:hypothetical protein